MTSNQIIAKISNNQVITTKISNHGIASKITGFSDELLDSTLAEEFANEIMEYFPNEHWFFDHVGNILSTKEELYHKSKTLIIFYDGYAKVLAFADKVNYKRCVKFNYDNPHFSIT